MGRALHKLGQLTFRHPVVTIGFWIVILAVLGFTAITFIKPASSAITIPGTDAQKALDKMSRLFPDAGKGSGRIVFAAPNGKTIDDYKSVITKSTQRFADIDGVSQAVDYTTNQAALSKDKTIAYTQLQLKNGNGSVEEDTIKAVGAVVSDTRKAGLQTEMGGDVVSKNPSEIIGIGEIGGLVVALIVLVVTLGSLIAAGMPLITALIGVGVSMAGLFSLSQVITITSTTPVLAVMLGLAVGIDYSLFIINRYRTYLSEGYSFADAAGRSIGTAGNAVLFAASTVIIALAALSVVQIPFMTSMGLAAAAAIAVAAAVAVTLTPALMRLAGRFVLPRRSRSAVLAAQAKGARENHHANRSTFWYKWGEKLVEHPVIILVLGIIILTVVALPVRDLTLGLPTDEHASPSSTERKAYDLLSKGFGVGFNAPLIVIAEGLPAVSDSDRDAVRGPALKQFSDQVAAATSQQQALIQQQLASARTPQEAAAVQQQVAVLQAEGEKQKQLTLENIEKSVNEYAKLIQLKKVADKIAMINNVSSATPALATQDGTSGLIQVIPDSGPSDKETLTLINMLRDPSKQEQYTGGSNRELAVTGTTAVQNDVNVKLAAALPIYLGVVIGLSFIILIIAFRSVLVPLKATLGFLLSVLAMFGALVATFQWGWFGVTDAAGPIISFLPIIAVGILFGLAMDYEFFLVSSMHEAYTETNDAQRAVKRGFAHASKVVVAAAFIMVAIFAGFITNHDSTIRAIGLGLAFGIFVDAFIVRLLLVPAAMSLLGRAAWWLPKWLDRILPHVSIEGESKK